MLGTSLVSICVCAGPSGFIELTSLAHLAETVPWVLVQETHGNIESGTSPALKSPGVAQGIGSLAGDVQQVDRAHASSEQGLVGVTPGGIHDQSALVCSYGLREGLRTLLGDDISPALRARLGDVDWLVMVVGEDRNDDVALELRLADLADNLRAVDRKLAEVTEQLLSTVLTADELEKLWSVVDEGRPAVSVDESLVGEQRSQERNVALHSTNAELNKRTQNLSPSNLVG